MKQWTEERCSEKPQELQLIASDTYIERKNIKEVKHPADETLPERRLTRNGYAKAGKSVSASMRC